MIRVVMMYRFCMVFIGRIDFCIRRDKGTTNSLFLQILQSSKRLRCVVLCFLGVVLCNSPILCNFAVVNEVEGPIYTCVDVVANDSGVCLFGL